MSEPPEVVLSTEGLTAGYGGPPIIEDISLTVRAGKIAAIVGPNGAGKSTLIDYGEHEGLDTRGISRRAALDGSHRITGEPA